VVKSVADCYAALSVVHGDWQYIPAEFDDYIATPKDNHYRSIHTAVVGPEGRSVEIQIRTREMHEHAELGIAAHWQYKEGGARDLGYERKIEAVRRLLRPGETDSADRDFLERMRTRLFADRVYALTPKSDVIELPRGATSLDFAYHVHSDLGHRCRGAKVNGRIAPLTHAVSNGEVIEILTGKLPAPSRDWLSPELGYLASAGSRAKVRAWFRRHESSDGSPQSERAVAHAAPGVGTGTGPSPGRKPRRPAAMARSPVEVEGVGDLPITLARCCGPLRPQPIAGYVTVGRGVTIHLASCPSLGRMRALKPERVLRASWTGGEEALTPVELTVAAQDRRGLVRDLTDFILLERLSIEALTTTTDRDAGTAHVSVRLGVRDLDQLARLTRRLREVKSVLAVTRTR
ncbi:MAG: TGS domain-containing protein, partial [Steroidobacteraceae bacterium]